MAKAKKKKAVVKVVAKPRDEFDEFVAPEAKPVEDVGFETHDLNSVIDGLTQLNVLCTKQQKFIEAQGTRIDDLEKLLKKETRRIKLLHERSHMHYEE